MLDDDIAHFPDKYGENYLYILEVDPNHLHAFWEITPDTIPDRILKEILDSPALYLKVYYDFQNNPHEVKSFTVNLHVQKLINDRFIELDKPLIRCYAELGYYESYGAEFIPICRSNLMENSLDFVGDINPAGLKKQEKDLKTADIPEAVPFPEIKAGIEMPEALDDYKEKGRSRLVREIKRDEIIEYYKNISDRLLSTPKFSPWRSIIESMSSHESTQKLSIPNTSDIYEEGHTETEFHSSNILSVSD